MDERAQGEALAVRDVANDRQLNEAENVALDDESVYMGEWGSEEVDGFAKIVKAPKTGGPL